MIIIQPANRKPPSGLIFLRSCLLVVSPLQLLGLRAALRVWVLLIRRLPFSVATLLPPVTAGVPRRTLITLWTRRFTARPVVLLTPRVWWLRPFTWFLVAPSVIRLTTLLFIRTVVPAPTTAVRAFTLRFGFGCVQALDHKVGTAKITELVQIVF